MDSLVSVLLAAYWALSRSLSAAKEFHSYTSSMVDFPERVFHLAYNATLSGGTIIAGWCAAVWNSRPTPSQVMTDWTVTHANKTSVNPCAQLSLAGNVLLSVTSVLAASQLPLAWDIVQVTEDVTRELGRITHNDAQIQTHTAIVGAQ